MCSSAVGRGPDISRGSSRVSTPPSMTATLFRSGSTGSCALKWSEHNVTANGRRSKSTERGTSRASTYDPSRRALAYAALRAPRQTLAIRASFAFAVDTFAHDPSVSSRYGLKRLNVLSKNVSKKHFELAQIETPISLTPGDPAL